MATETNFKTGLDTPDIELTNSTEESMTDLTFQADTEVYALIEKYGIKSLMNKNKPEQELFIDTTILPKNMTLAEAMELKNNFTEYFEKAPAKFRKLFHDNPDEFYLAYKQGEYDKLISTGALTEEQVYLQKQAILQENTNLKDLIKEELKNELNAKNNNTQQTTTSIQSPKISNPSNNTI